MNGTKYIFIALIVLFAGSTFPAPGSFAGMIPSAPGWVENVSAVQQQYNSYEYGSAQTGDSGYNRYELPPRECYLCGARDCDNCTLAPYVSGFHCDWYSCSWIREYGCPTCPVM
jgi:hypothetical protein